MRTISLAWRRKVGADGVLGGGRRAQLALLGQRERGDVLEARVAVLAGQLVAVERRAITQVLELGTERFVVARELLLPRKPLRIALLLGHRSHSIMSSPRPASAVIARTRSRARPRPAPAVIARSITSSPRPAP